MASRRPALCGYTLLTTNTWSRRPAIASPTTRSAPPSAYISAVSISVIPRSIPVRNAATSLLRLLTSSPIRHVPWPRTGTLSPPGSLVERIRVTGNDRARAMPLRGLRRAARPHHVVEERADEEDRQQAEDNRTDHPHGLTPCSYLSSMGCDGCAVL